MEAYTSVFNGKNYLAWKIRVQMEIRFKLECPLALLDIPKNETPSQEHNRNLQEGKAMGALFSKLGDDVILQVRNANNVREVFRIFDAHYAHKCTASVLNLKTQISAMRLNPYGDVSKHFTTMDSLIAQLQIIDCGRTVTDRDCGMMYLASLPHSLRDTHGICSALLNSIKEYTSAHIKSTIMRQCKDMQMRQRQRREDNCNRSPDTQNRDHRRRKLRN